MVMLGCTLIQFTDIQQLCKFVKMKHRLVFAVFTKESDVFAKIHIFEVIRDKTAVATLDAFPKFL